MRARARARVCVCVCEFHPLSEINSRLGNAADIFWRQTVSRVSGYESDLTEGEEWKTSDF